MMWMSMIDVMWGSLARGERLKIPDFFPHPSEAGFRRLGVALPVGQISDWGLSLSDGSRIHVHELTNGRFVAHRDKFDPDQSFGNMIAHLFLETPIGPLVTVLGVCAVLNSKE